MQADDIDRLFDRLFPLCRSITGEGLRQSIAVFAETMPLSLHSARSGTRAFDWVVPDEWFIRAGTLTGPDGVVYADFAKSNLSVVNYSAGVDARVEWDELQAHLHSIPELPEAVPYVTSYYSRTWGFCVPDSLRQQMPRGQYHASIDAGHFAGKVDIADCVLEGDSADEVLLTSYLCHPSLANNELSGPLVLLMLYHRIAAWKQRRLTYRFALGPETIGSLIYLHQKGEHLVRHVVGGLVLTCLGGPNSQLSYKTSRREDALMDRLVAASAHELSIEVRRFNPAEGSDERQFCSPGFNLPIGQMSRTVYGRYPGYHNSLDTKEYMSIEALVESADRIESLLRDFELAGAYQNLSPFGEPQLGKRGLYPNLNSHGTRDLSNDKELDGRQLLNAIMHVLSYSDGKTDMLEVANRLQIPVSLLARPIEQLESHGLLRYKPRSGE